MHRTTIEALRDHQACTLYYKYKYIDEIKKNETNLRKTQVNFKETLISIVNYFFFKKMAHQEPSYKALENRWEKRWLKDVGPEDVVYNPQTRNNTYPTDTYYTVKAAAALLEFHKFFANKPHLEVVMYGEDFTVPLNKDVALDGSFDLVMRSKNTDGTYKHYIYTWSVNQGNKSADYWSTHFTALDYAFRYRNQFKTGLDITHYLWDFTDSKPGVREFVIETKDVELLRLWADNFVKNQEFYPIRTLSSYCKTCIYDKPCLNWQPEPVEEPKLKKKTA